MSRVVDDDFDALIAYLREFSLVGLCDANVALSDIKQSHRNYLPFLQFWIRFQELAKQNRLVIEGHVIDAEMAQFSHLSETVSDIGSGFFCCIQGAYKPAHMCLRSSIENFLRFAAGVTNSAALSTKNVYELFDLAKQEPVFSDLTGQRYYAKLKSEYSELCKFTHTATEMHMAGVSALDHFPKFDHDAFTLWKRSAESCMKSMAILTTRALPAIYLSAHFSAQEILERILGKQQTAYLLQGFAEKT
ncbi:hypothetical protein ACTU44_16305 [Thalassospira sp. SM2505]